MAGHTKLILGTWKMHFTVKQAVNFASKLALKKVPKGVSVGVAPHSLALINVADSLAKSDIKVIAQNAYFQDEGAFTGEISMPMLRGYAQYVIIGHSERRHVFHESNDLIREKVAAAVRSEITPVLCVGETLVEKQYYHTNQVISDQLCVGLANLTAEEVGKIVIAYEPIWAIGTGHYAEPEDVGRVVQKIRADITSLYGSVAGASVTVLYGGSASKENALSYLKLPGVNGLLVGGASLSLVTFWPIVELASTVSTKKTDIDNKESKA